MTALQALQTLAWHAGTFLFVIGLAAAALAAIICIADLRR